MLGHETLQGNYQHKATEEIALFLSRDTRACTISLKMVDSGEKLEISSSEFYERWKEHN